MVDQCHPGATALQFHPTFAPIFPRFSCMQGLEAIRGGSTGHEVLPIVSQCARELSPPLCGAIEGPGAGSKFCCDLQPPLQPHRPPLLSSAHPRLLNTTTFAAVPTKDPAGPHCSAPTLIHSTGPTMHPPEPQNIILMWGTGTSFHGGTGGTSSHTGTWGCRPCAGTWVGGTGLISCLFLPP